MFQRFFNVFFVLIISQLDVNAQLKKSYEPVTTTSDSALMSNRSLSFSSNFNSKQILRSDESHKNLGFICRQEWKLETKIGIPLKIRLGSLDYVNRLEGK